MNQSAPEEPGPGSSGPPPSHKRIAQHLAATWGLRPSIMLMSAEGTPWKQAIAIAEGYPGDGATTYATVGLSDRCGFELATCGATKNESFIKALFDVTSFGAGGGREVEAGACFEKVLARYYTRCEASSLLVVDVALPGLSIPDLPLDSGTVRWLYAWPLVGDEVVCLGNEGYERFARRLEAARESVDLLDLGRARTPGVPKFDPWGS